MRIVSAAVIVALVVAACGADSDTGAGLADSAWALEAGTVDGEPIPILEDHPITMLVRDDQIVGSAACNTYSARYRVIEGHFSLVDDVVVTDMGCSPPEVMESERAFLEALLAVDGIEVESETLILSGTEGTRLVFTADPAGLPPSPNSSVDPDTPVSSGLFDPSVEGSWELVSGTVDGKPIPIVDSHPITLEVSDEIFGGVAACNHYGVVVEPPPPPGKPLEIYATAMECVEAGVMESERAYLAVLERVVQSAGDGDELVLLGEGVELRFRATEPPPIESMTGTVWVLERVIDGDVVSDAAGERATLELYTDGSVIGSTGCRTFHGHYQPRGADVLFTEFGLIGECSDELVSQDNHVVSVLGDGFRARVDGETLVLTSRGHQGLEYRADQT